MCAPTNQYGLHPPCRTGIDSASRHCSLPLSVAPGREINTRVRSALFATEQTRRLSGDSKCAGFFRFVNRSGCRRATVATNIGLAACDHIRPHGVIDHTICSMCQGEQLLSLIHISEPTRLLSISYAVF